VIATSITARELDVLELVAEGYTNEEIAARMGISLNTVKNHLSRLFDIFGVTNRTLLLVTAIKAGAVTIERTP
jgi:DNA-binding CsgD family transcriptional regulator